MSQEKQEQIQSKYTEFQLLSQQVSQLEEQLNNVTGQSSELNILKNNIKELKDVKKDSEILVHLGHNIFTKAKLINSEEFITGIGAETLINRDSTGVIEFIANQIKELDNLGETMKGKISEVHSKLEEMQKELVELTKEDS